MENNINSGTSNSGFAQPTNQPINQPANQITGSPAGQPKRKNSQRPSTGLIIGMAVCSLIAVAGIAFGVYGMMESSHKSTEIDQLKTEISDQSQLSTMNNTSSNSTKSGSSSSDINITDENSVVNPIISAASPEIYRITYTTPYYIDSNGSRYSINLITDNSQLASCEIFRDNTYTGNCDVTDLSGDIYKIIAAGEGQNNTDSDIAFIMTDGSVQHLYMSNLINNGSAAIEGTYDIDGNVIDAIQTDVYQEGQPTGGYSTTLFILDDGSYISYGDIQ